MTRLKLNQWLYNFFFFNFIVFSLFSNYLPLEKGLALRLNKYESPTDALSQVWLKLAQWFLRKGVFKFCHCIFALL